MRAIANFGFAEEAIEFDHPDHLNGPALALVAAKCELNSLKPGHRHFPISA
ncbi:hypothetical protein [Mesorhizobium sp. CO1-1-8]|uniref:hypothetical protein n=1 Tax=Mesorhizobium sp. CO1-1-8 TaxID=2876631 RepID=UPI001CD17916|nr:hypothetical protein [Mesorhizobium sp. CO1-1-8]MBZ9772036.1 hypothetical protein [Mesorhizobium sp. CO1-1-8]